jgi:hypothetical protein
MRTSKSTLSDGNTHTRKHGGRPWSMELSGGIPKGKRSGKGVVSLFSAWAHNSLDSSPGSLRKRNLGLIRYLKVLDNEYVALTYLDAITVVKVKSLT